MSIREPKSLFSKVTAMELDKVRKHGSKPERIPGRHPSQSVLNDLGLRRYGKWPRNELAYEVIQEVFEDFDWKKYECNDGRRYVTFKNPPSYGSSLAELVLESMRRSVEESGVPAGFLQRIKIDSFNPGTKQRVKPLLQRKEGDEFAKILIDFPIAYPPISVMDRVGEWLERALKGERSTILTPVCPDYETVETGDPRRPRIYTFTGLGEGIGYVAQRALKTLPALWNFFRERGTKVSFVVAIGDFEADSEETCHHVGVTRDDFIWRLRKSQKAFKVACPTDMPLETPLVTEIDPDLWKRSFDLAIKSVQKGDFGAFPLNSDDIDIIAQARSSLYKRWYGDDIDCREVLLRQAPEYMAMGRIADEFPNTLIFGADAVAMAPFLQGLSDSIRPVLYLRNPNY